MRYSSDEYVKAYIKNGSFPKIHEDIALVARKMPDAGKLSAIDLGACTGLLTKRMSLFFKSVTGIESSDDYISRSVPGVNIKIFRITPDNVSKLGALISGYDAIIARRVFPELHDAKVANFLPPIFYKAGIKYILLEGRKKVKRPANPLWNADLEARLFSEYYTVIEQYKEIRLLRRNP